MPTISQLPEATATTAQDELPVSQSGITRYVTVGELLSETQPAIVVPSGVVLGRASLGPGGPESISLGAGLALESATLVANGGDQASYPIRSSLVLTDDAVINASGTPMLLPLELLNELYSAGSNIEISSGGTISSVTDPSVTSQFGTLNAAISTTEANLAALSARVPTGGFVSLNSEGYITAPTSGQIGAGTITVIAGAGRTLESTRLDSLNILDFGAISGGADCTAAFTSAFASLPGNGGEIYIPPGDYWLVNTIVFSNKTLSIRGAGRGISRLHIEHTGVGLDISQSSILARSMVVSLTIFAENQGGQTAAAVRVTYPTGASSGYVTTQIHDVECFGYPNGANGTAPFPQTFLRGLVLNNCWSTQISDISWFGPPAVAGTTSSAFIEVNGSIDTRISGMLAYYGNAAILQTGYCQGIYVTAPVIVGCDYFYTQTNVSTWTNYASTSVTLLGFWVNGGEINTSLGIVSGYNLNLASFVGMDLTRDFGPATAQSYFNLTNGSNFSVIGCNFIGGQGIQDIAFNFQSTFNSSGNIIGGCRFGNFATVISILTSNGTVGLETYGLQIGNIPLTTAFIDNSGVSVGNLINFKTPANSTTPSGVGNTKDYVFCGATGSILFRINNVANAANFTRLIPASTSNPPTIVFDGSDGTVNGVIQTKGGDLFINAAGGSSGSGNLLSLLNIGGATNWIQLQNSTQSNLCLINTNSSGLAISPHSALWLSPGAGLFFSGLPTTRPTIGSGQVWNNGGVLSIA